ncbi:rhamnan synthesis F family protein [Photobacterium damselae]|uniref:rhamnan synthesis F family protein n=1 Tax=Photobacterium damselae TaxID=38293 RepID=UPI001F27DBE2|nr:rhamnan synthesis F family protein [Photobacterium damselae]UKA29893.1 hypothetical protein IPQ37_04150 [Photobacterium damselae subsp. damselae]
MIFVFKHNVLFRKKHHSKNIVILHLYYIELFQELFDDLINIDDFDIIINFGPEITLEQAKHIESKFNTVAMFIYPNIGRDIYPFIKSMKFIDGMDYKHVIKIHSKKSKHRIDGDLWRQHLIKSLIGSKSRVIDNLRRIGKECSLLAPKDHLFKAQEYVGSNQYHFSVLSGVKLEDVDNLDYRFPAGSMYIAEYYKLQDFIRFLDNANIFFEEELGQVDGTVAHAIERFIGYYYTVNGLKMLETE